MREFLVQVEHFFSCKAKKTGEKKSMNNLPEEMMQSLKRCGKVGFSNAVDLQGMKT